MQLICGAVLGVLSGISLALQFSDSFVTGSLIVLGSVGVCALAAVFLEIAFGRHSIVFGIGKAGHDRVLSAVA